MDALFERANVTILQSQLPRLELQRVRCEYEQMRQRLREQIVEGAALNDRVGKSREGQ
jgi:hypothetical protein